MSAAFIWSNTVFTFKHNFSMILKTCCYFAFIGNINMQNMVFFILVIYWNRLGTKISTIFLFRINKKIWLTSSTEIADLNNAKQLKEFCMYFMLGQFDEVCGTETYKNLSPKSLEQIHKFRKPKESTAGRANFNFFCFISNFLYNIFLCDFSSLNLWKLVEK